MVNLDWLYGTWQINMDISLKIIPEQYKDEYQLNICVLNNTEYYLRLQTKSHGVLDWFGPYTISKDITTIKPDKNGIIHISKDMIKSPTFPSTDKWPLSAISENDLSNYPVLINTTSYALGIYFNISWASHSWGANFFGTKGCFYKDSNNPYNNCYPTINIDKSKVDLSTVVDIPALCLMDNTPPNTSLTIPGFVWGIVVGIIVLFIILITIIILCYRRKSYV